MKYLKEFRDPQLISMLLKKIKKEAYNKYTLMEICGGQTHSIIKHGLDYLLPSSIELIHGPGCPVCVTPETIIDQAVEVSLRDDIILCSFGDMIRVPGTKMNLQAAKALGGHVHVVYSPLDCLAIATQNQDKQVVFLGIGFETTAPANAVAIYQAFKKNISNFSMLISHVLVPPAMEMILKSPNHRIEGFLAAGHVCTVMGFEKYHDLANTFQVPIVITGFEPVDILQGVLNVILQINQRQFYVENQYTRVVQSGGNLAAQGIIDEVFEISDTFWRGIGFIPKSGLKLKSKFQAFDAQYKLNLSKICTFDYQANDCGEILLGQKKPQQCTKFSTACTPERPLGAPMVSHEGVCNAYYVHKQFEKVD